MAEVYKIGVEIALAGTIMQGLEAISAKLLGINTKVKDIEGGFARWGLAIGGAAAIFTGGAMAEGIKKVVDAGGELVKQQALLKNMGFSGSDVNAATNAAQLATQRVIGTTIAENVKGIRELTGVMPNLQEAMAAYPEVARVAKVLESMKGIPADQSLQTLAKAVELRGGGINPETGQLDPQRYIREVEAAGRAVIASGGLVDQKQLLNFMQTAGPMARMVTDPDKFYGSFITAMMDMGGFRSGTALTAVGRQLLGGKMTKPTADEMQEMGLLKEGMWKKSGTGVFVEKGGLVGEDILKDVHRGVGEWMKQVLIPSFTSHGITAPADVQQELYRIFGTETGRRMAGLYIQNSAQIDRDKALYNQALGTGGSYGNVAGGDLGANVKNLQDAVVNFLQAFGAPMVPGAIDVMQKLASGINSLAQGALAHPEAMKLIGEGLIGLSAALVVLGGAAVVGAMAMLVPGGAVTAGLLGLAAAGSALAAINWASISSGISSIASAIASLPGAIAGGIAGIPGAIKGAITGAFSGGAAGAPSTPFHGQPMHPSGLGPQSPNYPKQTSEAQPIHNRVVVMLDGRILGEAMSSQMAQLSTFPRQASYADPYASWASPDYNFQTG